MCKYMIFSKNAFYQWQKTRDLVKTNSSTDRLIQRIKFHFIDSKEIYGSYRIQKMLERENLIYARSYVSGLMQKMGLKSVLKRKHVVTTDSNHAFLIAKNELNRDFMTLELGEKWVSDSTYIRINNK